MRGSYETGSGNYVNGVYTTKNGFNNSGLGCPKGTRLYDTNVINPFIFLPEDNGENEEWKMIKPDVAPDILPYYAVSTYGRVMNVKSEKVMKENFRPNGYSYFCLAADNCKNGQKKYSTHRMVMMTFEPVEGMDDLQVNHINGNKKDNYINKIMPDGTMQSNLEWVTDSENKLHRNTLDWYATNKLSQADATNIRNLRDQGLTFSDIAKTYNVSATTIQNICNNVQHKDPNYTPNKTMNKTSSYFKITDDDAVRIRQMHSDNMSAKDIYQKYYPNASYSTILDIINNKTHTNV